MKRARGLQAIVLPHVSDLSKRNYQLCRGCREPVSRSNAIPYCRDCGKKTMIYGACKREMRNR